jgi:riboflavin transporter 2
MAFIIGSINIASEVIYMPYMIEFKQVYLPAYFIGVGLSACIPSLFSIAQGASDYNCVWNNETLQFDQVFVEARFSVSSFYYIMFGWMCVASFSFYLINSHAERIEALTCCSRSKKYTETLRPTSNTDGSPNIFRDTIILTCLAFVGFSFNTLIPSIQSYAALPFSQKTYFWSLTLSSLAQPIGAFASFFIHPRKTWLLLFLTSICLTCTGMVVFIASQSPSPILKYSIWGSILIVGLEIVVYSIGFLLRTALLEAYRDDGINEERREFRLFFGGLITQVCLINYD